MAVYLIAALLRELLTGTIQPAVARADGSATIRATLPAISLARSEVAAKTCSNAKQAVKPPATPKQRKSRFTACGKLLCQRRRRTTIHILSPVPNTQIKKQDQTVLIAPGTDGRKMTVK